MGYRYDIEDAPYEQPHRPCEWCDGSGWEYGGPTTDGMRCPYCNEEEDHGEDEE